MQYSISVQIHAHTNACSSRFKHALSSCDVLARILQTTLPTRVLRRPKPEIKLRLFASICACQEQGCESKALNPKNSAEVLLHAGLHAVPANAKGKVAEEEGSET